MAGIFDNYLDDENQTDEVPFTISFADDGQGAVEGLFDQYLVEDDATPAPEGQYDDYITGVHRSEQSAREESQAALDEGSLPAERLKGSHNVDEYNLGDKMVDQFESGLAQFRQDWAINLRELGLTNESSTLFAARMADLERQVEAGGMSLTDMERMEAMSDMGWAEAAKEWATSPDLIMQVMANSMGRYAPGLAATAGAGAVTGGAGAVAVGVSQAIPAGLASFGIEYAQAIKDEIADRGLDPTDPLAWQSVFREPEMLEGARERGVKRGIGVALFDAVSAGFAGRLLAGAKPTRLSMGGRAVGELGFQATAGGAGEMAGSALAGEEAAPSDVLAEMFAEIPTGAAEIPGNYRAARDAAIENVKKKILDDIAAGVEEAGAAPGATPPPSSAGALPGRGGEVELYTPVPGQRSYFAEIGEDVEVLRPGNQRDNAEGYTTVWIRQPDGTEREVGIDWLSPERAAPPTLDQARNQMPGNVNVPFDPVNQRLGEGALAFDDEVDTIVPSAPESEIIPDNPIEILAGQPPLGQLFEEGEAQVNQTVRQAAEARRAAFERAEADAAREAEVDQILADLQNPQAEPLPPAQVAERIRQRQIERANRAAGVPTNTSMAEALVAAGATNPAALRPTTTSTTSVSQGTTAAPTAVSAAGRPGTLREARNRRRAQREEAQQPQQTGQAQDQGGNPRLERLQQQFRDNRRKLYEAQDRGATDAELAPYLEEENRLRDEIRGETQADALEQAIAENTQARQESATQYGEEQAAKTAVVERDDDAGTIVFSDATGEVMAELPAQEVLDKFPDIETSDDALKAFWAGRYRSTPQADISPDTEGNLDTVDLTPVEGSEFSIDQRADGTVVVKGDPEAIRAKLPDNLKGLSLKKGRGQGLRFSSNQAPRVIAALTGNRGGYSRGGVVAKSKPMKNGKYVGAPEQYSTPVTIKRLRKLLRKLTTEGERGRYWYENSSKAVLEFVGGDVGEARKFIALLSIYSPQAKVDTNTTFAIRAWTQYKAGVPIDTKTASQDEKATNALADIEGFWSGEKTGNFYHNLLIEVDPATRGKQGATIDMWMMRAGEYDTDAPNASQYAFMEDEINRIAEEMGWEPQQVQAAIWVAMKARMENSGVKAATEEVSYDNGWIDYEDKSVTHDKKNPYDLILKLSTRIIKDEKKHRDNWLKHAREHEPTAEDTSGAKFDFADGLERHIGQVSWEATPSVDVNDMPGIHNATYEQKLALSQAIQAVFYNNGVDVLAQYLGLLRKGDVTAPGLWMDVINPSVQEQLVMVPVKGEEGKPTVPGIAPESKKLLDVYAAIHGLVMKQDAVGYHRLFKPRSAKAANAAAVSFGRPLTGEEMRVLVDTFGEIVEGERAKSVSTMRESGEKTTKKAATDLTRAEKRAAILNDLDIDNVGFIATPDGVNIVSFNELSDNKVFHEMVRQALKVDALPDSEMTVAEADGNLIGHDWKEDPNGQSYIERIDALGRPEISRWVRDVLVPKVEAVKREYAETYGWGEVQQIALTPDEAGAEGVRGAGYGTGIEGSVQVEALHYSRSPRSTLNSDKYGTGIRGAESRRVNQPGGVPQRIHFYVNEGKGVRPEQGTGLYEHRVQLNNLYNWVEDANGYWQQAREQFPNDVNSQANWVESQIVADGFDGVYAEGAQGFQGVAVLLGEHSVPIENEAERIDPRAGMRFTPEAEATTEPGVQRDDQAGRDQRVAKLNEAFPHLELRAARVRNAVLIRAVRAVERALGRQVIFVRGAKGFNGVVDSRQPDVIFISADTSSPILATMGHELLHTIRLMDPDLYQELGLAILKANNITDADIASYREWSDRALTAIGMKPLSDAKIIEEMIADFQGEVWNTPAFWDSMAQQSPSAFRQVATAFLAIVDKILNAMRRKPRLRGAAYIRDVEATRTIILDAMAKLEQRYARPRNEQGQFTTAADQVSGDMSFSPDKDLRALRIKQAKFGEAGWKPKLRKRRPPPAATYPLVPEDQIPTKTQRVFKLMRVIVDQLSNGQLFPLFAFDRETGQRKGYYFGKWHLAEINKVQIGNKELARRGGVHAVKLPVFDQGQGVMSGSEQRVWVEVEMPAVDPATQAESDNSPVLDNGMRTGITDRLPGPREAYDYKTNPNASADAEGWPISGSVKLHRIVGDGEVESILRANGLESQIDNSKTLVTDETAAELTDLMYQNADVALSPTGDDIDLTPTGAPAFDAPANMTLWDSIVTWAQDRFRALVKIQDAIGPVADAEDANLHQINYPGRVMAWMEDFKSRHMEPILRLIQDNQYSIEEVGRYLHARHAREANRVLKRRNPTMRDNDALSGMTDAEADAILAQYAGDPDMVAIGRRIDAMNREKVDVLEREGVLASDEANAWRYDYTHYVPLNRDMEGISGGMPGTGGSGFQSRGKSSKFRGGSKRAVDHGNLLAYAFAGAQAAIVRVEKNKVARSLYELASNHPNEDVWEVDNLPQVAYRKADGTTGYRPDVNAPGVVGVKIDGVDHYVILNMGNEVAAQLYRSWTNAEVGTGFMSQTVLPKVLAVMRFFSMINTSLSPEFMISNFFRDFQTAGFNLNDTELKGMVLDTMGKVPAALAGIHNALRGDGTSEWAIWYKRMEAAGGTTGWMQSYDNIEARAKDIEKQVARAKRFKGARNVTKSTFDLIGDYNTIVENGVRLAAFRAAVDANMSERRAAKIAKELTVNFNQKGTAGPYMNAMWLFYNASVQGTARTFRAMKNRRVQALVGASVALAAMTHMLAYLNDDDDDYKTLSPDMRERNLVVPKFWGDGKGLFMIPLPWGYNVFHVLGQEIGDAILGAMGEKPEYDVVKSGMRLGNAALNAFNPVNDGSLLLTLSPTLLDPLVKVHQNVDWHGGKLYPDWNEDQADHLKYFRSAREPSVAFAKFLADLTQTDDMTSAIDVSPEVLDMAFDTFTGAAGRFVLDGIGLAKAAVSGELDELETRRTPLFRKVWRDIGDGDRQRLFYEAYHDFKPSYQAYRDNKDDVKWMRQAGTRVRQAWDRFKQLESEKRKMSKRLREAYESGNEDRVSRVKEEQTAMMLQWLEDHIDIMYR